ERRLARMLEVFEHRGLGHVMHELSWRNADEVRIPDVVFYRSGAGMQNGILIDPPLLAIEILSPSQRQSELFAKCEAYHAWGAPCCWVIDPSTKTAWEYHCGETVESKKDLLTAGEITISIADLFA
ncbi:MAG: Uma2 family endonuclease, partial [Acidobacteriaceae bacterium]|nr:Uma2 family endonuclease [Acidobacteriaceae bacterium]